MPESTQEPILQVHNVNQSFGDRVVLRDINFSISRLHRPETKQGRVLSLLGKSGRGKTTLARIIAGLRKPTSGEVLVNKEQKPVKAGEVGFVFQDYILFEHLTVLGNLLLAAYQGEFNGNPLKDRLEAWLTEQKILRDKIEPYLDDFDLRQQLPQYPCTLSGGQRQRLAVLSQVLCSSHYIVLDEPFSGQDPVMKQRACEMLAKVARLDDFETLIIITHDIECAVLVSDTLLLIGTEKDGEGKPKPGSTIFKPCDLMEMGLAWHDASVCRTKEFTGLVDAIRYDWFPAM